MKKHEFPFLLFIVILTAFSVLALQQLPFTGSAPSEPGLVRPQQVGIKAPTGVGVTPTPAATPQVKAF